MASEPDLTFIMEKDGDGELQLWACRGKGRGCKRNTYRSKARRCDDCVITGHQETLDEVRKRLMRGDA